MAARLRRNAEGVLSPATADAVVAGLLDETAGGDTLARVAAEIVGTF
ncbi:hypothetical protein [Micromonospora sp. NPDC049282]